MNILFSFFSGRILSEKIGADGMRPQERTALMVDVTKLKDDVKSWEDGKRDGGLVGFGWCLVHGIEKHMRNL